MDRSFDRNIELNAYLCGVRALTQQITDLMDEIRLDKAHQCGTHCDTIPYPFSLFLEYGEPSYPSILFFVFPGSSRVFMTVEFPGQTMDTPVTLRSSGDVIHAEGNLEFFLETLRQEYDALIKTVWEKLELAVPVQVFDTVLWNAAERKFFRTSDTKSVLVLIAPRSTVQRHNYLNRVAVQIGDPSLLNSIESELSEWTRSQDSPEESKKRWQQWLSNVRLIRDMMEKLKSEFSNN